MYINLQHNDDLELWNDLKRKEHEYDKRRNKRIQYFESVRHAQTVQIEDIPLPQMSDMPPPSSGPAMPAIAPPMRPPPLGQDMSIMPPIPFPGMPPPSLHRPFADRPAASLPTDEKRGDGDPPGCPCGPPPNLLSIRELDSDYEDEENIRPEPKITKPNREEERIVEEKSSEVEVPKPTSVQQRILALAGQKYDDFMKELENVHKNKEKSRNEAERAAMQAVKDRRRHSDDESNDGSDNENSRSRSPRNRHSDNDSDGGEHEATTSNATKPEEPVRAVAIPEQPRTFSLPRPPPAPPMPPMMMKLPR